MMSATPKTAKKASPKKQSPKSTSPKNTSTKGLARSFASSPHTAGGRSKALPGSAPKPAARKRQAGESAQAHAQAPADTISAVKPKRSATPARGSSDPPALDNLRLSAELQEARSQLEREVLRVRAYQAYLTELSGALRALRIALASNGTPTATPARVSGVRR